MLLLGCDSVNSDGDGDDVLAVLAHFRTQLFMGVK
jgi:hypothetical protein